MRQFTSSRPKRSEGMPIGELSRLSGVNIETIRYYERIKIVPAPPRTQSGRRLYGGTDPRVLAFIRRCRELGVLLAEIRTLLRVGGPAKNAFPGVHANSDRHLEQIRGQ